MAAPPAALPEIDSVMDSDIFSMVAADAPLLEKVRDLRAKTTGVQEAVATEGALSSPALRHELLSNLLITGINGAMEMPEQKVTVEYLRTDQKLTIPYALGMAPYSDRHGETGWNDTLGTRYWKISRTRYHELKALVTARTPFATLRTQIDGLPAAQGVPQENVPNWIAPHYTTLANGQVDSPEAIILTYTYVSQALQFNCDIRDTAFLLAIDMRPKDDEWRNIENVVKGRLLSKLKPYTLNCIAAMNLQAVADSYIAAWTRAYGVSMGLLPHHTSRSQREYKYRLNTPPVADLVRLTNWEKDQKFPVFPLFANILAMFGIFHLNKDHTFRTGDGNMERIGTSYMQTLRTLVDVETQEVIKGSAEAICRTAAHPFGLAQTYWLAKVMSKFNLLSSPLAIRINSTPPPVQRLYIVQAAALEWESLPIGQMINSLYRSKLNIIKAEIARIDAHPPDFSSLHRLYGVETQATPSAAAWEAADALMLFTYGFAMTQHSDESNKRDGIALALSLNNVEREKKAAADRVTHMWANYLDRDEKDGLISFVRESLNAAAPAT